MLVCWVNISVAGRKITVYLVQMWVRPKSGCFAAKIYLEKICFAEEK